MKTIADMLRLRRPGPAGSRTLDKADDAPQAPSKWGEIRVSQQEIDAAAYKKHLGGGAAQWDLRGQFQLFLLKKMGLHPSSRLLDVGCGPIRAGVHFISYLDSGNYFGFDFNKDFIRTARQISNEQGLAEKHPRFEVVENFELPPLNHGFDYAIVFSVLNHVRDDQRVRFFEMIARALNTRGKAYVSHASWFAERYLDKSGIRLTNQFDDQAFNIRDWGWPEPEKESVFPIIELTRG